MKYEMRLADVSDSVDILEIYAPYITDTVVSFEAKVPSISEFSSRIATISSQYPFLVYKIDDKIVGYAYASKHRERIAYLYDVDVSVYVLPQYHGSGVSYKLYDCLFSILRELGYINAHAAYTEPNIKSMKFHYKFGFSSIGTHHKTGFKFGQWHDVTWLEKVITEHDDNPTEPLAISEVSSICLEQIFNQYTTV